MTARRLTLASLVHGLALLFLALAPLVPAGLWLRSALDPRPQLRWAITADVPAPNDEELWNSRRFLYGGTIWLSNEGDAPTAEVRVRFDHAPEHIDAHSFGANQDLSPPQDTDELLLGPLDPGHEVRVNIFGYSPYAGLAVLEDGREVQGLFHDPSEFDDPEAWFPDWAVYAGALVIAGLLLEVLSLRAKRHGQPKPGTPPTKERIAPRPGSRVEPTARGRAERG